MLPAAPFHPLLLEGCHRRLARVSAVARVDAFFVRNSTFHSTVTSKLGSIGAVTLSMGSESDAQVRSPREYQALQTTA